jgi:hypothetical protein
MIKKILILQFPSIWPFFFFVKYIQIEIEKVRIMFTRRNVRFTIQVYEFENSDL